MHGIRGKPEFGEGQKCVWHFIEFNPLIGHFLKGKTSRYWFLFPLWSSLRHCSLLLRRQFLFTTLLFPRGPSWALCRFPGDALKLWGPMNLESSDCHPPPPLDSQKPSRLATQRLSCWAWATGQEQVVELAAKRGQIAGVWSREQMCIMGQSDRRETFPRTF